MTYIVRIDLLDAESEDHDRFHEALKAGGFSDTIYANDNSVYQLPTGEYWIESDFKIDQMLAKSIVAARLSLKKYRILVTESKAIAWEGLEPAGTESNLSK